MFFTKQRVKLVRFLIEINESIFFYKRLKKVFKEIFKNSPLRKVIDVGVNRGQTIKFLHQFSEEIEIIGFEPNKSLFEKVREMKFRNVSLHNCGCSDSEGTLVFNENILDESSTFENVNSNSKWLMKKANILGVKPKNLIKQSYPVKVIQLADFINEHMREATIDLIKIDVEGHELKVLKGLFSNPLRSRIKFIQVEVHNDDLYEGQIKNEIIDLLELGNFSIHKEIKHGFGSFSDIIFINNNH